MSPKRRTVLKTGGLVAALSVSGLAGCSGILGGDEKPGPAELRYDPSVLAEAKNKFFGEMDYAGFYENREHLPESTREETFQTTDETNVNPEDIDTMTGIGGAEISVGESSSASVYGSFAVLGSFEAGTIQGEMEDDEAKQIGEYEGYTLYENVEEATPDEVDNENASAVAAVRDGVVIVGAAGTEGEATTEVTGRQAAEAMIDAGNGNVDRLDSTSEYTGQLNERFTETTVKFGGEIDPGLTTLATTAGGPQAGQFVDGIRAGGFGMTVDGETTTMEGVLVYEDSGAAEDTGIVDVIDVFKDQAIQEDNGISDITAEYDGNAVVMTMEGETKRIFEETSSQPTGGVSVAEPGAVAPVSDQ